MLTWNDVKGIGPARRAALEAAGFAAPEDLAQCLPVGYRDFDTVRPIAALRAGMETAFAGTIEKVRTAWVNGRSVTTATVRDDGGAIACVWFAMPWMAGQLEAGARVKWYGRVSKKKNGGLFVTHPTSAEEGGIQPVYRPIEKLPPKTQRLALRSALDAGRYDDALPETFRNRYALCPRQYALRQAHFPDSREALEQARRRLAFEELTLFQTFLWGLRARDENGVRIASEAADAEAFWSSLPFTPTGAQKRVLEEVRRDMAASAPMARLVQGDVGCGKTAIAFGALYLAAKAGYQGALMAPTEVLAAQHYRTAQKLLEPLGVRCVLLTGKQTAKQHREALAAAASGEARVVIGTHALISEGVKYENLGLAITDEQHRFGVRQRGALSGKGGEAATNVLVLSATPIPRTLSLVLFGDLDVSIVDELPAGRKPVKTRIVPEEKRAGMYGFIRAQAAAGRQSYIICPLVSESDMMDCKSAEETYAELKRGPLASLRLGLVHGKMKAADKDETLRKFSAGELDALVSTTVVEVGVDVPNATVMAIENADRFGLSQLHQLRGRVGRGSEESWCFLLAASNERLDALCSTNDGFELARLDLEQRGPGEWFGTRQHGAPEMPGAQLGANVQLIDETQRAVKSLFSDPQRAHEAALLRQAAEARYGKSEEYAGRN